MPITTWNDDDDEITEWNTEMKRDSDNDYTNTQPTT